MLREMPDKTSVRVNACETVASTMMEAGENKLTTKGTKFHEVKHFLHGTSRPLWFVLLEE